MATHAGDVLEAPPPEFSAADAERMAAELFGFEGAASPLASERDQNFRLRSADGSLRVLKLANPAEDPATLDFQTQALLHLARSAPDLPVPRAFAARSGDFCPAIRGADGRPHRIRLLSYVPGTPIASAPRGAGLCAELGRFLARVGHGLRGFHPPAAPGEFLWDLSRAGRLRARLPEIEDPRTRRIAGRWLEHFDERVARRLSALRAQVIHNDASQDNTLVDERGLRVVGLVDFGDMVHGALAQDLAVAIAELLIGADDPFDTAAALVSGYDEVEPLRPEERALLLDLVATRLAIAVAIAAWRGPRFPQNHAYIAGDAVAVADALAWVDANEGALRAAFE